MKSEALLIGNKNMSDEKKAVLKELLFRMNAVKTAEDKKYVLMNAPKDNEAADVDLGSNPKAYKKADVTKESSELQNMVNHRN